MKGWTEQSIKDLAKAGKIRGYQVKERPKDGRIVSKHFKKRSKEKDWMAANLLFWANEHTVQLQEEYRFDPRRRWRADWAFPAFLVLIEYEGLNSEKSRHTTLKGYSGDTQKYREAAKQGWIALRYTALNYREVIGDLDEVWRSFCLRQQNDRPL